MPASPCAGNPPNRDWTPVTTQTMAFTPPRGRVAGWLLKADADVPANLRSALVESLYGTLPIFAGGVINTIAVALLIWQRHPSRAFALWVAVEIACCLVRLAVLVRDRRAAARGGRTATDLYIALGVLWAASVGYGSFISVLSGDWVAATLACLSAAAMVGGIAFRNFAAPRLVAVMILLSLGPCAVAAVLSGQKTLLIVALQIPAYLVSMTIAAFRLNRMLVATMRAEADNRHRARHDDLTGLLNRTGLQQQFEAMQAISGPCALLYLDLDGFKGVNDRYGHAAGDELLKNVAGSLRAIVGPKDSIARIGGDEFIILSPCNRNAALRLGQTIASTIGRQSCAPGQQSQSVGVSVGIAACEQGSTDLHALMGRADAALYRAKANRAGCLLESEPGRLAPLASCVTPLPRARAS